MIWGDNDVTLSGRHFSANIALSENFSSGLININRDPRKQARKPDAFVGVVENVGPDCFLVKPGDKVVFRRWDWGQANIDDERIIAEEEDLIVLDGERPAPGIIVLALIVNTPKTSLALPDTMRTPKAPSYKGQILDFSPYRMGELKDAIAVGDILYFQRSDSNQWSYGDGRIAIKVCRYFEIMCVEKQQPVLTVV